MNVKRDDELQESLLTEDRACTSIADAFLKLRIEDLRLKGRLGSKWITRQAGFRNSLGQWLSLIASPHIPVLISGESHTGKKYICSEYFLIHRFYFRLLNPTEEPILRIFQAPFLNPGFTSKILKLGADSHHVVYIENIENLSPLCQEELLQYLQLRKEFALSQTPLPRIICSSEGSLSIRILQKQFSKELFQALASFTLFIPNLKNREEDLPYLLSSLSESISGVDQSPPPAWLVDHIIQNHSIWNLKQLQQFLKMGFRYKARLRDWVPQDSFLQQVKNFQMASPQDVSSDEQRKQELKKVLESFSGDRNLSAKRLQLSKSELSREILRLGIRSR